MSLDQYYAYGGTDKPEKILTFHEKREVNYKLYRQHRANYRLYSYWDYRGKDGFKGEMKKAFKDMVHFGELAFVTVEKKSYIMGTGATITFHTSGFKADITDISMPTITITNTGSPKPTKEQCIEATAKQWVNFGKVKDKFERIEAVLGALLLQSVGPDPRLELITTVNSGVGYFQTPESIGGWALISCDFRPATSEEIEEYFKEGN